MATDTSVMQHEEDSSFEDKITSEYLNAVANGFQGTKEEYLALRDYI